MQELTLLCSDPFFCAEIENAAQQFAFLRSNCEGYVGIEFSAQRLKTLRRNLSWTPKTGQGPKVENRCLKEKRWDSGSSSRRGSRRRSR